jgi:hypothetical protein
VFEGSEYGHINRGADYIDCPRGEINSICSVKIVGNIYENSKLLIDTVQKVKY